MTSLESSAPIPTESPEIAGRRKHIQLREIELAGALGDLVIAQDRVHYIEARLDALKRELTVLEDS
jgi:hypothetical protein